MTRFGRVVLLILLTVFLTPNLSAIADGGKVAFQSGVLTALMEGVFEGDTTFADLEKQGDMGIGTFNGLDGEMAAVDGVFYRIKFDGTATPAISADKTPFATITRFSPDKQLPLGSVDGFSSLAAKLDRETPTDNIVYAVRIDGLFAYLKARSVPGYQKPYPKLPEIVKTQSRLTYENEEGTLVGFRFPEYAKGVNVPGWHLHFLTKDRKRGGHVLDIKFEKATAGLVYIDGFSVKLQNGGELYGAKLGAGAETKGVFTGK